MVIQSDLKSLYQGRGLPGMIARPVPQACFELVKAGVASGGDNIKPGWGVFRNATNDDYREPTTDQEELDVVGIVGYTYGTDQTVLSSIPTGANSNTDIQYKDDAEMRIMIEGCMYLLAGEALEKFDRLRFDRADNEWKKITTPTTIAGIPQLSVVCLDETVANGALFAARVQLNAQR